MFAVPGWNVSASSLVQEQPRGIKHKTDNKDSAGVNKKRKRDSVTGSNRIDIGTKSKENVQSRPGNQVSGQLHKRQEKTHSKSTVNSNAVQSTRPENNKPKHARGSLSNNAAHEKRVKNDEKVQKREKKNRVEQVAGNLNSAEHSESQLAKRLAQVPAAPPSNTKLTPLQAKMRNKLTSARFRHLNETLYTSSSRDAMDLFTASPDLFTDYHAGFSQQVKESWPQNPVEAYIHEIKTRGSLAHHKDNTLPLPRRKTGSCTVADLGCGDAPLARGCQSVSKKHHVKFHSYDLYAPNDFVTKADISNLPLRDGEADIAIFCLSLMGTNWISFVEEAWRIVRGDGKGEVWVAEVKSRFGRNRKGRVVENSVGNRRKMPKGKSQANEDEDQMEQQFVEDARVTEQSNDETDVTAFVEVFRRRGFILKEGSIDKSNKMFVTMVFIKAGIPVSGKHKGMKWNGQEYQRQDEQLQKAKFPGGQKSRVEENFDPEEEAKVLKPCVYKIR